MTLQLFVQFVSYCSLLLLQMEHIPVLQTHIKECSDTWFFHVWQLQLQVLMILLRLSIGLMLLLVSGRLI